MTRFARIINPLFYIICFTVNTSFISSVSAKYDCLFRNNEQVELAHNDGKNGAKSIISADVRPTPSSNLKLPRMTSPGSSDVTRSPAWRRQRYPSPSFLPQMNQSEREATTRVNVMNRVLFFSWVMKINVGHTKYALLSNILINASVNLLWTFSV